MTNTSATPVAPPSRPHRRSRTRQLIAIVAVIALALVVALGLAWCGRQAGAGAPGAGGPGAARGRGGPGGPGGRGGGLGGRPPTTVGVARATLGEIPITQSALGTVTPLATVQVNARVSGQLVRVGFREGEIVRKGQLLMQLDPRPYQIALQQAQAALAHDEALLADARLDLNRYATLKAQNSIATQTYDTQLAAVRQDEATVKQDEANVANARLNLEYTRVTAPVSGRVGLRQIDVGNQVTANQSTPVTVVTQLDPISIIFPLPEDAIPQIMARHGGAGLEVTALDRSGGEVLAKGRLLTIDNAVNTSTGTVNGRASFANPGGRLFPFQFVNVIVLVDTLHNQVVVPTTAVRHGPQGDYVWVLQPNRTVRQRPVQTGPATPETVSIVKGLQAGESVITDGGDRLRDGAPVILPGQGGGRGGHGGGWTGGPAPGTSRSVGGPPPASVAAGSPSESASAEFPAALAPRTPPVQTDQAAGEPSGGAARGSAMQACRADVMKLCSAEASSGDRDAIRGCMRQNFQKLSPVCQASIKARMSQGGGRDGG